MFLYDVFQPEFIKIGLESENKIEVFEELVDKLLLAKNVAPREEILKALWEREHKMSTGIQKGLAIPHAKVADLVNVCGVLGISKKGIDYAALDGKPVYIIFMVLSPQADSEEHLRLLKGLVALMGNREFYTELLAQKDPGNINKIIKKYEDIYISSDS